MEGLDYAALGSFVALVLAWVVLPLRSATVTPVEALEPAAVAA
jgi:hypothetical protein